MEATIGGTVASAPAKKNALRALMALKPKSGHEYNVLAYVLNRDMIKSDGSLDELHGVVFSLGSFGSKEKAEKHAKQIIEQTGHPGIVVAGYGCPIRLTTDVDTAATIDVPVDVKGKLVEWEDTQYKKEKDAIEKKIKVETELMEEAQQETNPDHIEHYKRQWYLAIKNKAMYMTSKASMEAADINYQKRVSSIKDHYTKHPEHDTQFLSHLKEKLIERGEGDLYENLATAYKELHPQIITKQ